MKESTKRPVVNKYFFNQWNPNMAYVLGFIFADGCLLEHKNGYYGLDITSKDKDLLVLIKNKMQSNHKIGRKTRGWHLQIRNAEIYKNLLLLGLTPRKSKTMVFPKVPNAYISDFIRGYLDGDGGITVWQEPRWKHTWQIRVTFSSASREFLKKLHNTLLILGIVSRGRIAPTKKALELCLSIDDSLKLHSFIYRNNGELYLKRKKRQFENFIRLRNRNKSI